MLTRGSASGGRLVVAVVDDEEKEDEDAEDVPADDGGRLATSASTLSIKASNSVSSNSQPDPEAAPLSGAGAAGTTEELEEEKEGLPATPPFKAEGP